MVRKLKRFARPDAGNGLPDGYINALVLVAAIVGQARRDLMSRQHRKSAREFLDRHNLPHDGAYSIVVAGGEFFIRYETGG